MYNTAKLIVNEWTRLISFLLVCIGSGCASPSIVSEPEFKGIKFSEYLNRFKEIEQKFPGGFSDSIAFKAGPQNSPHLVVGCMVHGDEIGCLPAVIDFFEKVQTSQIKFNGKVTIFLGNPRAGVMGKRFVEQDLNRVFADSAPDSHERIRAIEISPLLKTADFYIDLHQTIEATDRAFYIFAFSKLQLYWAQYLEGATTLVTRPSKDKFAKGMLSTTEFATNMGVPSVTLELGQKGFSEAAFTKTLRVLERAVLGLDKVKSSRNLAEIKKLAKTAPDLAFFTRVHSESFEDPRSQLNPGYKNFSAVKSGEILGTLDGSKPLIAPKSGLILFPKYPERDSAGYAKKPLPTEIFQILRKTNLRELDH